MVYFHHNTCIGGRLGGNKSEHREDDWSAVRCKRATSTGPGERNGINLCDDDTRGVTDTDNNNNNNAKKGPRRNAHDVCVL